MSVFALLYYKMRSNLPKRPGFKESGRQRKWEEFLLRLSAKIDLRYEEMNLDSSAICNRHKHGQKDGGFGLTNTVVVISLPQAK